MNALVALTVVVKSRWLDRATHAFFLNDGRVQNIIVGWFIGKDRAGKPWWNDISGSVYEAEAWLGKVG